jgi:hypothetical protein
MSAPLLERGRRPTLRQLVWCALVLVVAGFLVAPYLRQLLLTPFGLGFAAALAGYVMRRRGTDAAWLGVPVLVAEALEMGIGPQVMALFVLPLFAVTARARFSATMGALLLGLLVASIRFKERFAGTLLTFQDVQFFLLQFADNLGVMASQPTLLAYIGASVLGMVVIAWAAWRLDARAGTRVTLPLRLGGALLAMGLAAWTAQELRHEALAVTSQSVWALSESELGDGHPLARFLSTAFLKPAWTPPRQQTAEFGRHVAALRAAPAPTTPPADIVVFLQESQFNPATIDGCAASLCDVDLFHPPPQNVSQGPLQVHVFGGGTWLSEFAMATGVPHQAFGRAGDFAPFNVAPGTRRSFIRSLKAAGYRTAAVYPVRGGMMNARVAYAGYGFDRFYDAADLGLPGNFDTSDDTMHDTARKVLAEERSHGQPVFLLVLTIFNHSEHGVHMERVPAALQGAAAADFADRVEARNVADYVWRTREFGKVLGSTRDAVLHAGRPAVFAWFGDHQPPFGNAMGLRNRIRAVRTHAGEVASKFQTWYQVSSNVQHLSPRQDASPLDIVFLPGLLAESAGVPLDDWLAANVAAREECGGLLQGCRRNGAAEAYLSYLWYELKEFDLP